jgi:hypothetical protein
MLRRVFRDKFLFALKRLYSNGSLDCSGPAAAFQDRELLAALIEQLKHKKWMVGSWVLGTPEGAAARHIRVVAALECLQRDPA